jgi:alkyl hydroperoxide reductase subunit AhpC
MTIQLGQFAPDFERDSTHGPIHFHDWLGSSWAVLFRHRKDFTPVRTAEPGEGAEPHPEWARLGVKPIGLSVDPVEAHKWKADIAETRGATLGFPIIADTDAKVSALYGMTCPESDPTATIRSVFVIDPTKKVRLILGDLPSTGGTFAEVLRTIDRLQLIDAFDPVI